MDTARPDRSLSLVRTLPDLSRHHAATRPDQVALHFAGHDITYAELDLQASRVANGLIAEGVGRASRLAILDKNHDSFFEIWLGAVKANAVLVPVNWRLAPPEVRYVVNDAQAEVLFVGQEYLGTLDRIRRELTTVRRIIVTSGHHASLPSYEPWRDGQDATDSRVPVAPSDVAAQLYTSGTTGHPKGAQLTHANLFALLPLVTEEWGRFAATDVSLVCMPLFHIAGSGYGLCGLYVGATNVLLREVDPRAILQAIPAHRITKTLFVPAVILFLLETPGCQETDFSSLELVLYGASPIPVDLLRRAMAVFKCRFAQVYGLTETTGAITYLGPEHHHPDSADRMLSCGRPMAGVELRILDADGQPLPPRQVGEIVCRTPQIMKGYWNLPEATAQTIRGEWLHTGDAGYLDEEGFLYIYDRVKDMIISGGENIYPAEVESALFGHPAIADVAVIGVPDERWGESVKAVVVTRPGHEVTAAELIAYARERIAGYKVPRSIDFVATLPRNPSGKILKRELRLPYWRTQTRQVH